MDERDLGPQPLGGLMDAWKLSAHDLVEASPEQLTHKQVQRARSGRRLTLKMMMKMARALNFAIWGRMTDAEREELSEYLPKHLFNYGKGHEAGGVDQNAAFYGLIADRPMRREFRKELGLDRPAAPQS